MITKRRSLSVETPSDREIRMTREFDAPRELVWKMWTNPEHVRRWMLGPEGWTMPVCEIDLRPGGRWRFVWRQADGTEMESTGVYQEIDPPARVVYTESWGSDWPEKLETVVFTEEDGLTRMESTLLFPSREARDAALRTEMEEGMAGSLDRLEDLLRSA